MERQGEQPNQMEKDQHAWIRRGGRTNKKLERQINSRKWSGASGGEEGQYQGQEGWRGTELASGRKQKQEGDGRRGSIQARPGPAWGQGTGQEAGAQCPLLHLSVHRSSPSLPLHRAGRSPARLAP